MRRSGHVAVAVAAAPLVASGCGGGGGTGPAPTGEAAVKRRAVEVEGGYRRYRLFTPPAVDDDDRSGVERPSRVVDSSCPYCDRP